MARTQTDLSAECDVFCRYLTERHADAYVIAKYAEAHEVLGITPPGEMSPFDTFAVRFARRGWRWTRLADIYTRWFYGGAVLRKKLLLLMAILECTPSAYDHFEAGDADGRLAFWMSMARRAAMFAICSVVAVFMFGAAQLVVACTGGVSRGNGTGRT